MLKERGSYNHDIGEQYGAEHQELGEILYPVYFLPVKKGFSCNMEPLPQPPFFFSACPGFGSSTEETVYFLFSGKKDHGIHLFAASTPSSPLL